MNVLVLGMHRSGTSVATRLVNMLGIPTCRPDDLLRSHSGNERGHWESASLVAANDRLLGRVGARWWCPPSNTIAIGDVALDDAERFHMCDIFTQSHPATPCVWKDPRNCITLPCWREAFEDKPVVVMLLRDPHAIAASLTARSGFAPRYGFALWERHLRAAITACEGLQVLTTRYEDLVADPAGWSEETAEFLSYAGLDVAFPKDRRGIDAFVHRAMEGVSAGRPAGRLSREQTDLGAALQGLIGPSSSFSGGATLLDETPTTEPLFEEVRLAFGLRPGSEPSANHTPFVSSAGIRLYARRRRRAPSFAASGTSVVMLGDGGTDVPAAERLRAILPSAVELVVLDPTADVRSDEFTAVSRPETLTATALLNLGAEVARGDLLVFCRAQVAPRPGWLRALRAALTSTEVGAAGPVIVPNYAPDLRVLGIGPRTDLSDFEWVTTNAMDVRTPTAVPALSRWAFATPRRVFEAVGGFDEGLRGTGVEDVEYCLRVWRAGYSCIAVPNAEVVCTFPNTDEDDPAGALRDLIRLSLVHLDGKALERALRTLASWTGFAAALADVAGADAGPRRVIVDALSWYPTTYVLEQFGIGGERS